MAHLEIKSWKQPDGTTKEAANFTVHVAHDKRRFKVPGFGTDATGRRNSEELGRNLEKLLDNGMNPDLRKYLETLSTDIRMSLARQGIIDPIAEGRALADHLADYTTALQGRGVTAGHVTATGGMIEDAVEACRFKMLGEVTPAKLRAYLADRRKDKPRLGEDGKPLLDADKKPIMVRGISARRHNAILAAWGGFFRWCVRERRAFENPVVHVPRLNERTDKRHERRALAPGEVRALLTAAKAGGELYGMSGADRALLYRVAVETGLRMNELATLTRDCVDLDGATMTVRAANSKHRREDVLPIRAELVEAIREQVERKTGKAKVFNTPNRFRILDAFHHDCQAAAIARCDVSGRVVDFHALRHTFISSLASGGVHPKTAQILARHSTITLTMDRYTHTLRGAEAAALSALPDYSTPDAGEAKKTGTDGAAVTADRLPTRRGERHGEHLGNFPGRSETKGESCMNDATCEETPATASVSATLQGNCSGRESNPHLFRDRNLNPAQQKFNPLPHKGVMKIEASRGERHGEHLDSKAPVSTPPIPLTNDPELRAVADAWPTLPAALKAGIVAMVKGATAEGRP